MKKTSMLEAIRGIQEMVHSLVRAEAIWRANPRDSVAQYLAERACEAIKQECERIATYIAIREEEQK
jgi:hypothetical protein